MTYQQIRDDKDKDLGQDEASKPIRSMDASFQVCRCTDRAMDRIGFAVREGRRHDDSEVAWYVCIQGQGDMGLHSVGYPNLCSCLTGGTYNQTLCYGICAPLRYPLHFPFS